MQPSDLPDLPQVPAVPDPHASTVYNRLWPQGSELMPESRAALPFQGNSFTPVAPEIALLREVAKIDRQEPVFPETVVDVPGVGACIQNLDGVPFLLGASPEPLLGLLRKEEKREALLIQLVFAARDLAARTVESVSLPFEPAAPQLSQVFRCRECRRAGYVLEAIRHTKKCHAGRVLALIDDLSAAKGPKSARPCPACGAIDDAWVTEEKPASEIDLTQLEPNQGASAEVVDGRRVVRTHLCASEALHAADQGGSQAVSA